MKLLRFVGGSLRRQLLFGLTACLLVIMSVAGVLTYNKALHETDEIFSARLATSARVIDTLLMQSHVESASILKPIVIELPPELTHLKSDTNSPLGQAYETKLALQVWSKDNRLLIRSSASPEQRLGMGERGFFTHEVEGERWHVFALETGRLWVEVAEKEGLRSEVVNEITETIGMPFIIAVGLLLLVMNVLVGIAIRPLANLGETIAARQPEDTTRVRVEDCPAELNPVIKALNDLLEKIQRMVARERRFTDSAAHEMRTPLAALLLHAQNAANAEDEEERAISLAQLMTGLNRTNHLVEQMLSYSRISSGTHGEVKKKIDLVSELQHAVGQAQSLLELSDCRITTDISVAQFEVMAYPGLVGVLFNTLLDNAIKYHNPEKPEISLSLFKLALGGVRVAITNHMIAPLTQEEIGRITEPYYRPPKTSNSRGNGLGLAIAIEVANLHSWSLDIQQTENLQFQVVLTISAG